MTDNKKAAILAHIDKIEQYAKKDGDGWLLNELEKRFGCNSRKIDEIYEYCIEKVICEQAEWFYKDFPIPELRQSLVKDFCRMERYKRENNFEDFCLATFQQVETITNYFCQRQEFIDLYDSNRDKDCNFNNNNGYFTCTIRELIINSNDKENYDKRKNWPLIKLYSNEKIRAVLYFVYFKEKNSRKVFEFKYYELNELYQCRNLNHRGGNTTPYQESIIKSILPHRYLYFLKFNGLLVNFVERISASLSIKKELGEITNVTKNTVFIKIENGKSLEIDNGSKLWHKVKSLNKGDEVIIERNCVTDEIIKINRQIS